MTRKFSSFYTVEREIKGFTLVEMILVVTIIGILSAVLISTINQQAQRKRAQDAVNRSSMEQATQGIESFFAAEGYYPTALDGSPNLTLARVREYLAVWPAGFVYVVNGAGSQFEVYVLASNDNYLKYDSSWGKIKVCTATQVTELGFCTDVGN